jgi:hypothetical protein
MDIKVNSKLKIVEEKNIKKISTLENRIKKYEILNSELSSKLRYTEDENDIEISSLKEEKSILKEELTKIKNLNTNLNLK